MLLAIELGATYELAAAYAGISGDTLDRWRKQKADFAEYLARAEGKAAVKWLAKSEKAAGEEDWRAAAWKLERRYPRADGRAVQEQRHSGPDGGPVPVAVRQILDLDALPLHVVELALQLQDALAKHQAEPAGGSQTAGLWPA